jgi:hypothetical protein
MENIALSLVLFILYFSVISCFQYSECKNGTTTQLTIPIEKQIRDMFAAIDEPTSEIDIELLVSNFHK